MAKATGGVVGVLAQTRTCRRGAASLLACGVLGVVLPLGAHRAAHACGGGLVSLAQGGVGADAQLIFISVRGNNTTDVVTQIGVPEADQDFGVLLPLPAAPTLDPTPVPADELTKLATATGPTIVHRSEDGGGCGCPIAGSKGGSSYVPPITIGDPVNIGPVTAVVLDAAVPEALNAWLAANSFIVPAASSALVQAYSGPGRTFVAIRRNTTVPSDGPTSVGVHFTLPGDVRDLPLRFAQLGAAARVAFTVFILAPIAAGPSLPFEAININDLKAADLDGPGYAEAVARAIEARQGRAFVAEFSEMASSIPFGFGSQLSGLVDSGAMLTRLSAVFAASALTSDVSFQAALDRPIPRTRTLALRTARGGEGGGQAGQLGLAGRMLGLPLLVGLCAWVFVRRRKRSPSRDPGVGVVAQPPRHGDSP